MPSVSASRNRRRTLAWLWTGVVLLLLWMPAQNLGEEASWLARLLPDHADKLGHALLFLVQGWLLWQALDPSWRWRGTLCLGTLVALLSELGQRWAPGRAPSLGDLLADVLGLVLGSILAWRARSPDVEIASSTRTRLLLGSAADRERPPPTSRNPEISR